jgi:bifunctional UDP-N-acetylglucosamine pyrophosphorylase / glucosamine-1-phosphate N-acetyltransferase
MSTSTSLHFVTLAAGKGTRMKSELPKVLHAVGGEPMIVRILRTASHFQPETSTVVVGHMADMVRATLAGFEGVVTVVQEPQLGTGHALLMAAPVLERETGTVVLLYGDVPMLSHASIGSLLRHHQASGAAATVLTAHLPDPAGLGRIVREGGRFVRIVEERDATPEQKAISEFNSGIYAFALDGLFDALRRIGTANDQGEYYLTDLLGIFLADGRRIETFTIDDADELRGVNSRAELAVMNAQVRDARNAAIMASGVTLIDPTSAWIGPEVEIGRDTTIHPNVYLEGRTHIGANCEIHAGVRVINSTIGDGTVVQNYCVVRDSHVDSHVAMGPFSHIRPDSHVGPGAHIGNFVELKKTSLGAGAKANHLAYLGDATIGAKVNVGAGVITCNYDGVHKHPTIIEDGAFIGTDSQLVAPVTVGKGAYVAAGSTIVENVPPGALAIGRGRQENKPGWVEKRKAGIPAKK